MQTESLIMAHRRRHGEVILPFRNAGSIVLNNETRKTRKTPGRSLIPPKEYADIEALKSLAVR